jgi:hypothetical protein
MRSPKRAQFVINVGRMFAGAFYSCHSGAAQGTFPNTGPRGVPLLDELPELPRSVLEANSRAAARGRRDQSPTRTCEYVSSVSDLRECPSCAATWVTGTPSAIFTDA